MTTATIRSYARPGQVRELAGAIALQAQAIADGTVGPRQMPVQLRKLADNVATLQAWTPTIDVLDAAHIDANIEYGQRDALVQAAQIAAQQRRNRLTRVPSTPARYRNP